MTPLGDSVTEFKSGMTYSLATDSQYAELECEGTGTFAVGPHVFTRAPPFNPRAGVTHTYDADGNRVKKSTGTLGTLYWGSGPLAESNLTAVSTSWKE